MYGSVPCGRDDVLVELLGSSIGVFMGTGHVNKKDSFHVFGGEPPSLVDGYVGSKVRTCRVMDRG